MMKETLEYTVTGRDDVLLPLGQHALSTLNNLGRMHSGCILRVSPFCHEHPDEQREVRGWVLDVPGEAGGHVLPISFNMFDGVSVVHCEMSEAEVFALMQDQDKVRQRFGAAVNKVIQKSILEEGNRASWARCKPCAYAGYPQSLQKGRRDKDGNIMFLRDEESSGCTPIVDSEAWVPELSPDGFVGLYHHWHRSARESRLCLYVVCQSYLPKACLEFADLVHQVSDACTASVVCLSEEAQWLRTACARNRRRIIYEVCEEMGLRIPVMLDYNAQVPNPRMAMAVSESLHHDMIPFGTRMVRILNNCTETRMASNGIPCVIAPWDSVWIFHGTRANREATRIGDFGVAHGGEQLMPTCAPRVKDRSMYKNTPLTFSTVDPLQCVVTRVWGQATADPVMMIHHEEMVAGGSINTEGLDRDVVKAYEDIIQSGACPTTCFVPNISVSETMQVLVFDEYILNAMHTRGWSRTQGITQLTAMACAMYEHLKPLCEDGVEGDSHVLEGKESQTTR